MSEFKSAYYSYSNEPNTHTHTQKYPTMHSIMLFSVVFFFFFFVSSVRIQRARYCFFSLDSLLLLLLLLGHTNKIESFCMHGLPISSVGAFVVFCFFSVLGLFVIGRVGGGEFRVINDVPWFWRPARAYTHIPVWFNVWCCVFVAAGSYFVCTVSFVWVCFFGWMNDNRSHEL